MSIIKIETEKLKIISEDITTFLGVNNIQLYNPIFSHYFKFYNNDSYNMFTLKTPKLLCHIKEKLINEYEDSYIKNMLYNNISFTNNFTYINAIIRISKIIKCT